MLREILILLIAAGVGWLIYHYFVRSRKSYNKALTVWKDIGGQYIKEIEFKVKEEQRNLGRNGQRNFAWVLVTEKKGGREYIWPRPPSENWMTDEHCYIYSKSYKGNNYPCLVEAHPGQKWVGRELEWQPMVDGETILALEDDDGLLYEADAGRVTTEDGNHAIAFRARSVTENRCVVFPAETHGIKAIFDERHLPEVVALHGAVDQMFDFRSWWEKWKPLAEIGVLVALMIINGLFVLKAVEKLGKTPIEHNLKVQVEGASVASSQVEEKRVEEPPETPPPRGMVEEFLKKQTEQKTQ